jgi:hypothetical protein
MADSRYSACKIDIKTELLKGIIYLDSKRSIIFDYDSAGWRQKIHLQPCDTIVRNYTYTSYDQFINTRAGQEFTCKVAVEGYYSAKHQNGVPRDTFRFYSIAILDSLP